MDNNELDKIIKEKLNGTIKPSKESQTIVASELLLYPTTAYLFCFVFLTQ